MAAQSFFPGDLTSGLTTAVLNYCTIIAAATMLLGGATLLKHHAEKMSRNKSERFFSLLTIAAVLFMIIAAIFFGTGVSSPYQWAFNNLQAPMQSTTFALLAFFVASSAYRGFRVRSKPALVLAISAFIVLLGRSGFGEMISNSLPSLAGWLLNNPSAAARRGLLIGVGLGSVATALRVILGIERSYQ
jgi:cytochrome bd-type quinol oxidase subunit 2